jgi:hypothetical protein
MMFAALRESVVALSYHSRRQACPQLAEADLHLIRSEAGFDPLLPYSVQDFCSAT